jgi:predicted cupin superfamily sugar epimerase
MGDDILQLIEHFGFLRIPLEGTFYTRSFTSSQTLSGGRPAGTAIVGMYATEPYSASTFHKVDVDEMWHFYKGDPFCLHLLFPDGRYQRVIMGTDILNGQMVQFTVPGGTWQAGELLPGARYALFGCTVTPGFDPRGFEAGLAEELAARYPEAKDVILRLAPLNGATSMPEDYTGIE